MSWVNGDKKVLRAWSSGELEEKVFNFFSGVDQSEWYEFPHEFSPAFKSVGLKPWSVVLEKMK